MTGAKKSTDFIRHERHDRLIRELEHDPYHSKRKIKEPAFCPDCGAIYNKGRWIWGDAEPNANKHLCPACQRVKDHVPAAYMTLRGDFLAEHRDEIMNLVENYEQREKMAHPLKRIMNTEETDKEAEFTFTDAHLARGIAEAIHNAYQGAIDYQYTKEDVMLRVTWER